MTAVRGRAIAAWRRCAAVARSVDERYGAIIGLLYGTALLLLTVAVLAIAWQVWGQTRLASKACERSREFGPYIARDYARRDVLPDQVQRRYEASIPRRCGD